MHFLICLLATAAAEPPGAYLEEQSSAEDALQLTGEEARRRRTFPVLGETVAIFSPVSDLYPRYVANPYRSDFRFILMDYMSTEIDGAGALRWGGRIGGRYGLLRFHREGEPSRGVQLSFEAGFAAQFDLESQLDNIGWDGTYGLLVAWTLPAGFVMRAGRMHDSSHIGDEFGGDASRINYTREEHLGGLTWVSPWRWRIYGEAGRAYHMGSPELMQIWRAEYGAVWESLPFIAGNRMALYAAGDTSHFEEDSWTPNVTAQAGLVYPVYSLGRVYRLGVEVYDGRSHIGEFFQRHERYVAAGVWFDL